MIDKSAWEFRGHRKEKYPQCSHCGMHLLNPGKCPFCGKGEAK